MTDQAADDQADLVYFERRLGELLKDLVAASPEIVATCKPGINARRVEGDQIEAYMLGLNGSPVVIGTIPVKWLRRPKT